LSEDKNSAMTKACPTWPFLQIRSQSRVSGISMQKTISVQPQICPPSYADTRKREAGSCAQLREYRKRKKCLVNRMVLGLFHDWAQCCSI